MSTTKRFFILAHDVARQRAAEYIAKEAPEGWTVTVEEPKKKRIQEEKYHAMIGDIAAQTLYAGKRWDEGDTKRILIDEFAEDMRQAGAPLHHDGDSRLIPSEDGRRVIQLGIQSREFWVGEAAAFIEWLYAYGDLRDVVWTEPKEREHV